MRSDLYGSKANRQQGTQGPTKGKSKPAAAYGRTSQRAAPEGNTTFTNTTRATTDAQDKKYSMGKYSKQRLFP